MNLGFSYLAYIVYESKHNFLLLFGFRFVCIQTLGRFINFRMKKKKVENDKKETNC